MADTMRAIVLDGPGPASRLRIEERPIPTPRDGWVLLRVHAFGLNRSELHTRLGETLCWNYHKQFGTPVKMVRPFNVYGPGQRLDDGRIAIVQDSALFLQSESETERLDIGDRIEIFGNPTLTPYAPEGYRGVTALRFEGTQESPVGIRA